MTVHRAHFNDRISYIAPVPVCWTRSATTYGCGKNDLSWVWADVNCARCLAKMSSRQPGKQNIKETP